MKKKTKVVVGDKFITKDWKDKVELLVQQRDVTSWLFSLLLLLKTPKYSVCKSLEKGQPVWGPRSMTCVKIPVADPHLFVNVNSSFVVEFFYEVAHNKKRKARVIRLFDNKNTVVGTLLMQRVKIIKNELETTYLEVCLADADEFFLKP